MPSSVNTLDRGVGRHHIPIPTPTCGDPVNTYLRVAFRLFCDNQRRLPSGPLEAKIVIEEWRTTYNTLGPHSSLGWKTPAAYAASRLTTRLS